VVCTTDLGDDFRIHTGYGELPPEWPKDVEVNAGTLSPYRRLWRETTAWLILAKSALERHRGEKIGEGLCLSSWLGIGLGWVAPISRTGSC